MIHFVSDTHFYHKNIIQYSSRPFASVEDMNERMIEAWNAQVQPDDTVYHLGDFAFCSYKELRTLMYRLNGEKHLILGNHDKTIIQHQTDLLRLPTIASIQRYVELKAEGQFFVLFHYGQRVWNKSHHGAIHLYGHSHGSLPPHGKSVDVGVDCKEITYEYRPVSIIEVLDYMSKRKGEVVDHHGMEEE